MVPKGHEKGEGNKEDHSKEREIDMMKYSFTATSLCHSQHLCKYKPVSEGH